MIGTVISHYKILEKLGEGGMGVVYKAEDTRLDRTVAIKFLPRQMSANAQDRKRFAFEAKAAAALNHPNIATIHAIEEADDETFIVMEYVEGLVLHERSAQGPLPTQEAVSIAVQVAEGLRAAHNKGIVHRDIKSGNIMLTEGGQVKIMDFGLAKGRQSITLTRAGTAVGTAAYMSPEQARGEAVDHRTDIWSFGVVLYEILTGKLPFQGDYDPAILYAILHQSPTPVSTLRSGIPPDLDRIIRKCLSREASDRYQTAEDLLADLNNLGQRPAPRRMATGLRRYSWKAGLLITAPLLLILLTLFWFRPFQEDSSYPSGPSGKQIVAVLPFSIRGSEEFQYLGEGMVDLLSTKLDGAGGWRSVDPRAVFGIVAQEGSAVPDLESGRGIARRLGAGSYVLGNIVEVGGKLQIHASRYDLARGSEGVAEGTTSGDALDLFALVDEVAVQLLVGQSDRPVERVTQIAAVTTHSLPALKAYLDGEKSFREGKFAAAFTAFQKATVEDTSFALAWYKLSLAAEWNAQSRLAREAARKAFQYSERLSAHDRQLLEAFALWRAGETVEAEKLYRTIVAVYPEDVEAWFQLGEVLFHQGPMRGIPISRSRDVWEKVLFFEPKHLQALWHLARIPARSGERTELQALVRRMKALHPDSDRLLEMLALEAVVINDSVAQQYVLAELARVREATLNLAVWNVTVYSDDPIKAWPLVELMTDGSRSPAMRALGHTWLAHLELIRGRWQNAQTRFAETKALDLVWQLTFGSLASIIPFYAPSPEQLERARRQLLAWDAAAVAPSKNPGSWFNMHDGIHPHIRAYLLGVISARLGDYEASLEHMAQLENLPVEEETGPLVHDMKLSIRAQIAVSERRFDRALRDLEAMQMKRWYPLTLYSPFYSQAFDRYQRAELLKQAGRYEEALLWYDSFEANSVYDLLYLAPSRLARGEIHATLGHREQALEHYGRFVELWKDADPRLQPLVAQVSERMKRLSAPGS